MSKMTYSQLQHLMANLRDCEDYLTGKAHSNDIKSVADHAARRAVMERQANLIERLKSAGLNLVDAEA